MNRMPAVHSASSSTKHLEIDAKVMKEASTASSRIKVKTRKTFELSFGFAPRMEKRLLGLGLCVALFRVIGWNGNFPVKKS